MESSRKKVDSDSCCSEGGCAGGGDSARTGPSCGGFNDPSYGKVLASSKGGCCSSDKTVTKGACSSNGKCTDDAPSKPAKLESKCCEACCEAKVLIEVGPEDCKEQEACHCCKGQCYRCRVVVPASALVKSNIKVAGVCCDIKEKVVEQSLNTYLGVRHMQWNERERTLTIQHDVSMISCDSIVELLNMRRSVHALAVRDGAQWGTGKAKDTVDSVIKVDGLCCASEARIVNAVLNPVSGVAAVSVSTVLKQARVSHDPALVSAARLAQLVSAEGLPSEVIKDGAGMSPVRNGDPEGEAALQGRRWPEWNVLLALVLWLVSLLQYVQSPEYMEEFRYVAIGAVVLCLPHVAIRAALRLRKCKLDINILMTLAVIGAMALGEYSEGAAVVTLFSLSDWLEMRATYRVRVAMNALLSMSPDTAVLAESGETVRVEQVPVGSRLTVREGGRFPLDGRVVQGSTFADESALTGESKPVKKSLGAAVSGGTVNMGGYVEMETTVLHEDSTVSRMIKVIEEANSQRAPTQQVVERIASVYTPVIFVVAVLMATIPWAWGEDTGREYSEMALVLLVVACPCALVISTPITYVCGLANAARKGILVRGGRHLEALGRISTLFMDKTGTVTEGVFSVRALEDVSQGACDWDQVLSMVHEAERGSAHPLATSLAGEAKARLPEGLAPNHDLETVDIIAGQGVRAVFANRDLDCSCSEGATPTVVLAKTEVLIGNSRLAALQGWSAKLPDRAARVAAWEREGLTAGWVGVDGEPVALYCVGDRLRLEAANSVRALRALGVEPVMLTGDNPGSAAAVSREVGIDSYFSELLPEDKVACIREAQQASQGRKIVGMVGDGVNDAPSLATANVSISLGGIGSAAALETADVVLMQDDIRNLAKAVKLGRLCYRKIKENIAFSIGTKLIVLALTVTVFPSLWLAIGVDVGSMLLVTLNSMSILGNGVRKLDDKDGLDGTKEGHAQCAVQV